MTLLMLTRRLLHAFLLILAVLVLNFLLIHLVPGDLAEIIAGKTGGATEKIMTGIKKTDGLDEPVYVQLGLYLKKASQGDLGQSVFYNVPVLELVSGRAGPTILLVATALLFAIFMGTMLGVLASHNSNGILSGLVTVVSAIGYSVPVFWAGIMLIVLFAWVYPLFPISDMYDITKSGGFFGRAVDILYHLVLPALTLGFVYLAQYARLTRASMLEVLGSDYIRTARGKGASDIRIYRHHALRNAVLPVVTMTGIQFGSIISAAVLVETVFRWPGLGTLALESILVRDYPTVFGVLFFTSLLVISAKLITELVNWLVDPRVRTGG
ncbi:ABC transporter permease subunit [Sneathiella litorea]|uniref:ABC transporter permease subunit n=1 Tax=Sneathiella litorea TaxID=2606216 RepID=A0A6L8W398_9PROT|nr:ABC transporter permease subunit [Sneathiella litorea]